MPVGAYYSDNTIPPQYTDSNGNLIVTWPKIGSGTVSYATTDGTEYGNSVTIVLCPSSCTTDLTITSAVISPNVDHQQTSNTITATNTINSGAAASYHAANSIKLLPGFNAVVGSSFKAYIQNCTGTYNRSSTPENNDVNAMVEVSKNRVTVLPNPSSGVISVRSNLKDDTNADILIFDMLGNRIFESSIISKSKVNHEINLSDNPSGVYIMHFKTASALEKIKFTLVK